MIDLSEHTVSKIGVAARPLANGLREIVSAAELAEQFQRFGAMVERWRREKEVTFLPVMHGAAYCWQQLMRHIDEASTHRERVIVAQSYGDGQRPLGAKVYLDWIVPERDVRGRHVLIIEDILDSGATVAEVIRRIEPLGPASIKTFFMIRKQRERPRDFPVDWVMFDIDDVWIVGAGLDHNGRYRHVPYVAEVPQGLKAIGTSHGAT
ncbi:MAG: hypothetical protein J5J06_02020 [Phycisphaerae bacterium]|nr:hypothetical protein [Phycisphaerae bacterium]